MYLAAVSEAVFRSSPLKMNTDIQCINGVLYYWLFSFQINHNTPGAPDYSYMSKKTRTHHKLRHKR